MITGELADDLTKIEFVKGSIPSGYKYKAYIPKKIWNKWRPDKIKKPYKTVKFGRSGYEQYHDIIGDWSSYDHDDEKRRKNYKKRHEPIEITINGEKYISYTTPFTNEFFSYWLMW